MSREEAQRLTWAWLVDLARATVALTAAGAAICAALWWLLEPRLAPYLETPARLDRMERLVATLIDRFPPSASIEFLPLAQVMPDRVQPSGKLTVTYTLRRNRPCATTVNARWYSVERNGIAPIYSSTFPGALAPVTQEFMRHGIVLIVPPLTPGDWAYAPELVPGGACDGEPPIYPPPAYFSVER